MPKEIESESYKDRSIGLGSMPRYLLLVFTIALSASGQNKLSLLEAFSSEVASTSDYAANNCRLSYPERQLEAARLIVRERLPIENQIRQAIQDVVKLRRSSKFYSSFEYLVLLYAQLRQAKALPLLQAIRQSEVIRERPNIFANGYATAYGFTYFAFRSSYQDFRRHCREGQPRDALSDLLLGWIKRDRGLIIHSLDSEAPREVLADALLEGAAALDSKALTDANADNAIGMGYRFEGLGEWSKMDPNIGEPQDKPQDAPKKLRFSFFDVKGKKCGDGELEFVRDPSLRRQFLIRTLRVAEILPVLRKCESMSLQ